MSAVALVTPPVVPPVTAPPQAGEPTAMLTKAVKAENFDAALSLIFQSLIPNNYALDIGSGASATQDCHSDWSWLIRVFMGLDAYGGQTGVNGGNAQACMTGMTTPANALTGPHAAAKAFDRFLKGRSLDDTGAMVEGAIDCARGVVQGIGGAAYFGVRIGGIVTPFGGTAAASIALPTAIMGTVGGYAWGLLFLTCAVWGIPTLYEATKFTTEYEKVALEGFEKISVDPKASSEKEMNEAFKKGILSAKQSAFQYLVDAISAPSPTAVAFEKCKTVEDVEPFRRELNKIAEKALKAHSSLENNLGKEVMDALRKEDQTPEFKAVLDRYFRDKETPDAVKALKDTITPLEFVGLLLESKKNHERKLNQFSRVAGGCAEAVASAAKRGLLERLACENPLVRGAAETEFDTLHGRVIEENSTLKTIYKAIMIVGIIGTVLSIIGFIVFPPGAAIAIGVVTTILTIAVLIGFLKVDHLCAELGLSGKPSSLDKKCLIAIGIFLLVVLGGQIGISIALGASLITLIGIIAFTAISGGLTIRSYLKTVENGKKWKEEHPDLQAFIEQAPLLTPEARLELFQKLDSRDKEALIEERGVERSSEGEKRLKFEKVKSLLSEMWKDKKLELTEVFALEELFTKISTLDRPVGVAELRDELQKSKSMSQKSDLVEKLVSAYIFDQPELCEFFERAQAHVWDAWSRGELDKEKALALEALFIEAKKGEIAKQRKLFHELKLLPQLSDALDTHHRFLKNRRDDNFFVETAKAIQTRREEEAKQVALEKAKRNPPGPTLLERLALLDNG